MDHDVFDQITVDYQGPLMEIVPKHCRTNVRKHFFCERVIAAWKCLKFNSENLRSITSFKRADLSAFLHYFK